MTSTIWNLTRALMDLESGRCCRSCGQPIRRRDAFGMSEGVCPPCRLEGANPRSAAPAQNEWDAA